MNIYSKFLTTIFLAASISSMGQGFIQAVDNDHLSLILNQECKVALASGEEVQGILKRVTLMKGYMSSFVILIDGEKVKYKGEDAKRLSVKASKLAKIILAAESATEISRLNGANFSEIINREYIIFELAMMANKSGKYRFMQLLNPGFDNKIKVYLDPDAQQSGGSSINGIQVTGGSDQSYLFVQNGEKAMVVRSKKYDKNFAELYSGCPEMLEVFSGEKIKWRDVAGHVFAFDQACK